MASGDDAREMELRVLVASACARCERRLQRLWIVAVDPCAALSQSCFTVAHEEGVSGTNVVDINRVVVESPTMSR